MTSSNRFLPPVRNITRIPNEVFNNNYGSGAFYQVNGVQNIYYCAHTIPGGSVEARSIPEEAHEVTLTPRARGLEPYETIIGLLALIRQQLSSLLNHSPSDNDNTITHVYVEIEKLEPLVRCVATIILEIGNVSPVFVSLSIFSDTQRQAFNHIGFLNQLHDTLGGFLLHPDRSQAIGNFTHEWSSLSPFVRERFRLCQVEMTQFMRVIIASRVVEVFGLEHRGLGEIMTNLPCAWDLHHPRVDTIWVREPVGTNWYIIPLRFCETWKDFATVIHQYCRNGPEAEYIHKGNWAMIHNYVILHPTNFTDFLKPEMKFDIGIVVESVSAMLRICPQCGHNNRGGTSMVGWIQCSGAECHNSFCIVYDISSMLPNERLTEMNMSKNLHRPSGSRVLPSLMKKSRDKFSAMFLGHQMPLLPHEQRTRAVSPPESQSNTNMLNTKFNRILAMVPHPPPETNRSSLGDREPVASSSSGLRSRHSDVNDVTPGLDVEGIRELRMSSADVFEHLQVLGKRYHDSKRKWRVVHFNSLQKRMPKRVVELAGIIYRATIDVGFLLAKMGIVPSKLLNINFQEIVINRDKLLAGVMSASIQDAGQLGETISTIRFALSDAKKEISSNSPLQSSGELTCVIDKQDRMKATDEALLLSTETAIERFIHASSHFLYETINNLSVYRDEVGKDSDSDSAQSDPELMRQIRRKLEDVAKESSHYITEVDIFGLYIPIAFGIV